MLTPAEGFVSKLPASSQISLVSVDSYVCVECAMTEDEGDQPRPSGIRSLVKPITLDQADWGVVITMYTKEGLYRPTKEVSDAFHALVWYRGACRDCWLRGCSC
jgi:hypothetical protein